MSSDLAKRIRTYRRNLNLTQAELAEKMGVSRAAVNNWENLDIEPNIERLNLLAEIFHISLQELTTGIRVSNAVPVPMRRIPVYGQIGAGAAKIADNEITEYISTDTNADFAVVVDGDSMQPTIMRGDLALIAKDECVESGQIAAVLIKDEEQAVCKRILYGVNDITLISDNSEKYPPLKFSEDEISILGRVKQILRKV